MAHVYGARASLRILSAASRAICRAGDQIDEEVLMFFASQAAAAIANTRTYHAEQCARADLEALRCARTAAKATAGAMRLSASLGRRGL